MTNAVWLLALLAQDPGPALDVKSKRAGTEYELTLTGKIRGAADGATVGLRFHRIVRRATWEGRTIESAPQEDGPGRVAGVEQGSFTHVERFDAPGEVEVRVQIDGAEGPFIRRFRVGTAADAVSAVSLAWRRIEEAVRELRGLLTEAGRWPDGCPGAREKLELRRKLARTMETARRAADLAALPAASGALRLLAADVEAAVLARLEDRLLCRWISNLSGKSFGLADAQSYLDGVEDLAGRERSLALLEELENARIAVVNAVVSGERRRWNRAAHAAQQALEFVRRAGDERLGDLPAGMEEFLQVAEAAMNCETAVDGEFRAHHEALTEKWAALDRSFRGLH